ncbi:unnamed protein product [Larinioides sclopetarius]|uniref:BTB domain-containing protein n=1 Tax=Larinioides sclopetarius TaxID=280406 RepID=A0AAV2BZA0_9ARAC
MEGSVQSCYFQWDIHNPFLPLRRLEASFYLGSPSAKHWKAILQPIARGDDYRDLSFILEYDASMNGRTDYVADSVMVFIYLKDVSIAKKKAHNFHFGRHNGFQFHLPAKVVVPVQTEPHHLIIRIDLCLPGIAASNEERSGLIFKDKDLKSLSEDLKRLLVNEEYTNMELLSRDGSLPLRVHSYIIEARWTNFFKKHQFGERIRRISDTRNIIQTEISHTLLKGILVYIYSGELDANFPDWKDAASTAELFEVIHFYELLHLYNVFVKNEIQQQRVTKTPVLIQSHTFLLKIVDGRPVDKAILCWTVYPNPESKFSIQIEMENKEDRWLRYLLLSNSPSRIYAEVNFQLEMADDNSSENFSPLHVGEYTIPPNKGVKSDPIAFMRSPEILDRPGARFLLHCFLHVTDGTTIEQVQSVGDETLQDKKERFNVLSDHMHELNQRREYWDMKIVSKPAYSTDSCIEEFVHKGILKARLPYWQAILENFTENDRVIPAEATSTLDSLTLPKILDYVYTGKVSRIPEFYHESIRKFAVDAEFSALFDFIFDHPASSKRVFGQDEFRY